MTGRVSPSAAELQRVRTGQDLTVREVATIIGVDKNQTLRYLDGSLPMPSWRWRLLMLELGLERPGWDGREAEASD